ncbi:MAG: hypothetical protein KAH07_07125 [Flavobacteriaceae bacterium]|nr:hypothetical protein [Flavobacteriaceae bacterium]
MFGSSVLTTNKYDWSSSIPIVRYVFGACFIVAVTALLNYELYYLTAILSLSFIAPGAKPMKFKQGFGFILSLIILTGFAFVFSVYFNVYPLVFMPLLCLGVLWIYYTNKFPKVIKLFAILSIILIPLMSLEGSVVASYIAVGLVFNVLMAVVLTRFMFWVIPWSQADEEFVKVQPKEQSQTEIQRFRYALNILFILLPLLLLFFIFKLSGGMLVLMFVAILSMSPALSNPKVGVVMIVANILGGLFAILAYKLLVVVPLLPFMILLILFVGFIFANNLFSKKKIAAIFGTGFSTFLLILGTVTSSDAEAGSAVWTRLIQISMAVIYVVIAFGILHHIQKNKRLKING